MFIMMIPQLLCIKPLYNITCDLAENSHIHGPNTSGIRIFTFIYISCYGKISKKQKENKI